MRYYAITIDVEPDCTPGWVYSDPLTFDGVSVGIRERLQPLFDMHGAIPTYLINNVVLENPPSVKVLRELEGQYELGTHLHGEFIHPERQFSKYAGVRAEANQCFFAPEVEAAKMRTLTTLFENTFDRRPVSFRAGRFSAGTNTIQTLSDLGYRVDTSVTPHVRWVSKRERPVDYSRAHEQPYFVKPGSYLEADPGGTILEVPVSIDERRVLFSRRPWRMREIWLRPVHSSYNQIINLAEEYLGRYDSGGPVVLNMMFHNVEVIPGKSPYTKTEADCALYLSVIEKFLLFCWEREIHPVSLAGLYDVYDAARKKGT